MVIELLAKEHGITEDQALKVLYTSHIGSALDDDSLGLYGQGPIYLQSLIDEDIPVSYTHLTLPTIYSE